MENTITQQITTDELRDIFDEQYSWSGYLWQDDTDTPFVFKKQVVNYNDYFKTKIPFIIEGFLVNEVATISLTIKNIDGVYYCYQSKDFTALQPIETFPAVEVIEKQGIKALQFIPIFKKQEDSLSSDFKEYVYSHQIFKGILS